MLTNKRLQELLELSKASPRMAIMLAAEEAASAERKTCADMIPIGWFDPLLSGPNRVLPRTQPYRAADIERLLIALKKRIETSNDQHSGRELASGHT